MSAVFAASVLWRRGSVDINDDEYDAMLEWIDRLPDDKLRNPDLFLWENAEDAVAERLGDVDELPVEDVRDEAKAQLHLNLTRIRNFIREDSDPIGGILHVGPYEMLIFAEASHGDVSEEASGLDLLNEMGLFEPFGFYAHGYPQRIEGKAAGAYGEVISAVFDCIAARRETKGPAVAAAADAVGIYEERMWQYHLGPAVDAVEDDLSPYLPEYPA